MKANPTIKKVNGRKGVRITFENESKQYPWLVEAMRNGTQWTGIAADREILEMLRDGINEALAASK